MLKLLTVRTDNSGKSSPTGRFMFVDQLLNETPTAVLEQQMRFTDARQQVLADDVANATTPGYREKDLAVGDFQKMLAASVDDSERRRLGLAAAEEPLPAEATDGDDARTPADYAIAHPRENHVLFHDGNNRSMEQLMSESAKNALTHNLAVELLRRQYQTLDLALRERVA